MSVVAILEEEALNNGTSLTDLTNHHYRLSLRDLFLPGKDLADRYVYGAFDMSCGPLVRLSYI